MPIEAAHFPSHEALARFFRPSRKRVPLTEAAGLLGMTTETLCDLLRNEDGRRTRASMSWSEAASRLLDAWPLKRLVDALGSDSAAAIPPAFHPRPVHWRIPGFIVRAMEHQADPRGVDDYLADLLYNEIQPETVIALREDRDFVEAYWYPPPD